MVQLRTKLDVVAHMASFIQRGMGMAVYNRQADDQSVVLTMEDPQEPDNKTYITTLFIEDETFSVGFFSQIKDKTTVPLAIRVKYSDFFHSVRLPISDQKLDRIYDDFEGDWSTETLPGFILYKLSTADEYKRTIQDSDASLSANEVTRMFDKVLFPAFMAVNGQPHKVEVSDENRRTLVKQFKTKLADVLVFPKDYDGTPRDLLQGVVSEDEEEEKAPESGTQAKTDELPTFDDEYEVLKNKPTGTPFATLIPSVGDDDLYGPGGKYPEMRPFNPGSLQPPHNGMIVDKNHPLFKGLVDPSGRLSGAPPGARIDDPFGQGSTDPSAGVGLPTGSLKPFGSRHGGSSPFGGPFGGGPPGFNGGFM